MYQLLVVIQYLRKLEVYRCVSVMLAVVGVGLVVRLGGIS